MTGVVFKALFGRRKKKKSKFDNRKSIDKNSKEATKIAMSGMKQNKKQLLKDRAAMKDLSKLQAQFHDMISGSHYGGVSKAELKKHFRKLKIKVEPAVFEKIYELMDVDKDGTIDENEFCVTMCYFLHHGKRRFCISDIVKM